MKLCVVVRASSPSCPSSAVVRALADHGHEVHVLHAPAVGGEDSASAFDPTALGRATVHRIPAARPGWWRRFVSGRIRRAAIARRLREIGPEVVHLADPADRGVVTPPGSIVLLGIAGGPSPPEVDASVLPDGRLVDRLGRPVPSPGVPPMPSGVEVRDGLDPADSIERWRVLTYLGSVDQLRRERRVRFDRPHRRPASAAERARGAHSGIGTGMVHRSGPRPGRERPERGGLRPAGDGGLGLLP